MAEKQKFDDNTSSPQQQVFQDLVNQNIILLPFTVDHLGGLGTCGHRFYFGPDPHTVPFFMLEPMALMLPLTYSDVLTKTGLGYTLSLTTVAPTIPAFPVIGPNNVLVSISLFCSLHTYPPVSALLNPTTAALVPRPVGSSTLH